MADKIIYKRKNYLVNKKFQLKYTLAIVAMLLVVMLATGFGLYMGMWGSIIENFSKFKVSQNLENVKRITDYEAARYQKGRYPSLSSINLVKFLIFAYSISVL